MQFFKLQFCISTNSPFPIDCIYVKTLENWVFQMLHFSQLAKKTTLPLKNGKVKGQRMEM